MADGPGVGVAGVQRASDAVVDIDVSSRRAPRGGVARLGPVASVLVVALRVLRLVHDLTTGVFGAAVRCAVDTVVQHRLDPFYTTRFGIAGRHAVAEDAVFALDDHSPATGPVTACLIRGAQVTVLAGCTVICR